MPWSQLLPCRLEEARRAASGRLAWIVLAGIRLAGGRRPPLITHCSGGRPKVTCAGSLSIFAPAFRASAVLFQSFVIHPSLPETTQQKTFVFRFRLVRLWRAGSIFCGSLPGIPVFAWTAAGYWIRHAQRHSCSPKVPFSRCPKGPQWPPRAMQALANTRATQEHPPLGAQLLPCPLEVNCFHEGPTSTPPDTTWHPDCCLVGLRRFGGRPRGALIGLLWRACVWRAVWPAFGSKMRVRTSNMKQYSLEQEMIQN